LARAEVMPGDIARITYTAIMPEFAIPLVISFIIGLDVVCNHKYSVVWSSLLIKAYINEKITTRNGATKKQDDASSLDMRGARKII